MRELKVRIAAKPASAAHEAKVTRMPLLSKLEAVARRELAYLRAVGDLPRDYPTLRDVVDEAIVQAEVEWQSVPEEKAVRYKTWGQHRTGKVRCCTQFLPPPSINQIIR